MSADYFNRELSWLSFNQRVLHEALDTEKPFSQRLRFLGIFSNNLDEFFMIRVGALDDQIYAGYAKKDFSGFRPKETLAAIRERVLGLIDLQSEIAKQLLVEASEKKEFTLYGLGDLTPKQFKYLERYFVEEVFPTLTPMAVDFGRPFPLVLNKSLNLFAKLKGETERYITMQIPSFFSRFVKVESEGQGYVWIEDLIKHYFYFLLEGYEIESSTIYRVTRNGGLTIDDDEVATDLLQMIESSLKQRKWGDVLRLEIQKHCDPMLLNFLCEQFEVESSDVYPIKGPIDLTACMQLADVLAEDEPVITFKPVKTIGQEEDIFHRIRQGDVMFHHPFHAFDPVVNMIEQAAKDPDVLAIKQVLYRVGGNSPIVKALQVAANSGKQVTVLLELTARFDEENNIQWAKLLEKNGCHVIYGIQGKKTHAKITLIVRKEPDGIRRYVHLSSGNYNVNTSKVYTDIGIMTCHEEIAQDASKFFNILSGFVGQTDMRHLVAAPDHLKQYLIKLIEKEMEFARSGRPARIVAKMNSLVDREIIQALYLASQAGVQIQLIVRGVCCLVPQEKQLSENIWVKSIVDDYLEHSRLFYFHQNGLDTVFLSSADWMPRNLERRIELMIPIIDSTIKEHVIQVLNRYWNTMKKTHELLPTGLYQNCATADNEVSCQKQLEKFYYTLAVNGY